MNYTYIFFVVILEDVVCCIQNEAPPLKSFIVSPAFPQISLPSRGQVCLFLRVRKFVAFVFTSDPLLL